MLSANSDQTGLYRLTAVAPGEYLLDASAAGLTSTGVLRVRVTPGEERTVPIELKISSVRTQVTVTAAGEPQAADSVAKAVDVVSVPEAESRGLQSVPDAVRFLPGMRVATGGGPGAITTFQSRGLRPEDTAVLLDGFRLRDPTAIKGDAEPQIGDLLLVNSSRIEVLRGSGSSLYGTNAVAGTVNILSDSGGGAIHGDLDLQGGGLGLFRGLARVAGGVKNDRLTYSAAIANLSVSDGVDHAGAVRNWSGQGNVLYAIRPNIRIGGTVFAKTGYLQDDVSPEPNPPATALGVIQAIPLTTAQIHLAAAGLPYDAGNSTFIPSLGDPDARANTHFEDSMVRLEHEINARLSYRIAYAFVDSVRDNRDGPGGPGFFQPLFSTSTRFIGRIGTLQAKVNYLAGSHQVITAGYEFEHEHYRERDTDENPDPTQRADFLADAQQKSHAVFAQDQIRLLDGRLQLLFAGRFTQALLDQPKFVNAPSAYAGVQLASPPAAYTGDAAAAYFFRRSSTKARAHVGNSFRLPSLYERFGEYSFQGFSGALGDPRLSPERAISLDGGIDQYLFHQHLKLSGTYFYSHLQQVIGYLSFPPEYVDPFGRSSGYYNTGGGIARGAEVSGEFRPTNRTSISASYTYTNARDRTSQYYTGLAVSPLQSPRIEPHAVKIVALQQIGSHVDLAMDFEGASDYYFPLAGLYNYAYQFEGPRQLGLTAGYSFTPRERWTTRLYMRVSNALDQDYYENGFRTPARWAIAGVRLGF